ncbi:MAG: RNA polymerase-binding transcription factor DksA [Verrucomicrobiae bacterium]|nr:RNA polymerase-binding transcription factor DksA [Verrucomicrobiae bacterium]
MKKTKAKKPTKPVKAKAKAKAKAKPAPKTKAAKVVKPVKPTKPVKAPVLPAEDVFVEPKKLKLSQGDAAKYKRLLVELRDHLIDGVNFLASDNLKRTARDTSGELSGYSMHMADAGTDNFDREFALSLVSNEQEALYEIEESLKRLEAGTFGICEMCEKPIRKERLEAVPFAKNCVQCQSLIEKDRRRPMQTTAVFGDAADEADEKEESEDKD